MGARGDPGRRDLTLAHILFVNPIWPHPAHSVRSANVVIFELIVALLRMGRQVSFLHVSLPGGSPRRDSDEERGVAKMEALGVKVLEPFALDRPLRDGRPHASDVSRANALVAASGPDVVLVPWTNWPTILFAQAPAVGFAYYGNPDPKVLRARAEFELANAGSRWTYAKSRVRARLMEKHHLSDLSHYELLGNVAANDAHWYAEKGHPNAFYIHNLWVDRMEGTWRERRAATERMDPLVIVGNVGKLDATGNTQGLALLAREIAPRLDDRLGEGAYEIHLFGAGRPHPAVAPFLQRPGIVQRGFVDDIDAELMAAPIFLCLNNATPFKVCHTRYLHAWSLGSCVVAHRDAALSIPEMVSGQNCLLGADMDEVADLVHEAAKDHALRQRIGEAGYETFREHFTAQSVAAEIIRRLALVGVQ